MREAPPASAFFDAIKAGELDRVKTMVSADPSLVDARDAEGSAILTAVYHRQKEIVNLLVARGAALSLFEAAAAGEIERVERLLADAGADLNAVDAGGWRPLHLAAANNNLDSMRTLVAQGADVTATNKDRLTAIQLAEQKNHKEAAALLKRHAPKT